jgi:hypothetical protein
MPFEVGCEVLEGAQSYRVRAIGQILQPLPSRDRKLGWFTRVLNPEIKLRKVSAQAVVIVGHNVSGINYFGARPVLIKASLEQDVRGDNVVKFLLQQCYMLIPLRQWLIGMQRKGKKSQEENCKRFQ